MDIFFEQAQKEIDLLYLEAVDELKRQEDLSCISFMESGDTKKKSSEGIFAKIKKMIETAIEKIKAFFAKKETNDKARKLQESVKKDPSLKNEKVKVKDYEKVIKLGKQTQQKMKGAKTAKEKQALLEKYKKQRNVILGGALVAISVAAILGFQSHGKDKKITEIEEMNKQLNEEKESYKRKYQHADFDRKQERTNRHCAERELKELKEKYSDLETNKAETGFRLIKERELNLDLRDEILHKEDIIAADKCMMEIIQLRLKDITDSVNEYGVKATNEALSKLNSELKIIHGGMQGPVQDKEKMPAYKKLFD